MIVYAFYLCTKVDLRYLILAYLRMNYLSKINLNWWYRVQSTGELILFRSIIRNLTGFADRNGTRKFIRLARIKKEKTSINSLTNFNQDKQNSSKLFLSKVFNTFNILYSRAHLRCLQLKLSF